MDVVVEGSCLGLAVFRAIWFENIGRIRHGHGNGIGRFTNSDRKDIEELVSELRNGGYLGFAVVPYSGIGQVMPMAMLAGCTQHRSPPMFTDRHRTMVDLSQPRCVRTCMEHK